VFSGAGEKLTPERKISVAETCRCEKKPHLPNTGEVATVGSILT
jgi:hypothetical protein